jgi:ribokinase
LNPAPAAFLPESLYPLIDIITPNESEAKALTGVTVSDPDSAISSGRILCERGVRQAVITLGDQGCVSVTPEGERYCPAINVDVVDTTGAGDAFNGALAYSLSQGNILSVAIDFANTVAALSVTKVGTVDGLPTLTQVEDFCKRNHIVVPYEKTISKRK